LGPLPILVATTFQGEEAAGPLGIGGFFSYPPRSEKFPIIKRSGVAAFWNMSRLGKADGDFLGGRLARYALCLEKRMCEAPILS
jgi:hypothetical protein